jgi:hypothetical protein
MWNPDSSRFQVVDTRHRVYRDASGCHWLDVAVDVRAQCAPESLQLWLMSDPPNQESPQEDRREAHPYVVGRDDMFLVVARFRIGDSPSSSVRPVVGDGMFGCRAFLIALPLSAEPSE